MLYICIRFEKQGDKEVEKGLSGCEKKKKKIFKKFCRNGVEDYLCCPARSCLQERRRKRKELKPKGFDKLKMPIHRN